MSAKNLFLFIALLLLFVSCQKNEQFPAKRFEHINAEEVEISGEFVERNGDLKDSTDSENFASELKAILLYKNDYEERNVAFNLANLKSDWQKLQINAENFGYEDARDWIEITGFLLEITGESIYAGELEKTCYLGAHKFTEEKVKKIEEQILPWVFTKNVDHIQVNLFVNSTIKYNHTLKGAVQITQETAYPDSGKVRIKFEMENKRYIELYIRIPEWAENVSIIEKGVKYVATPGAYSQIVRKWKDGNVVEIDFSMDNKPNWLK